MLENFKSTQVNYKSIQIIYRSIRSEYEPNFTPRYVDLSQFLARSNDLTQFLREK